MGCQSAACPRVLGLNLATTFPIPLKNIQIRPTLAISSIWIFNLMPITTTTSSNVKVSIVNFFAIRN